MGGGGEQDAAEWAYTAERRGDVFDVIMVDSTDFGTSDPLHGGEFYSVLRRLAGGGLGIVVINLTR